MGTVGDIDQMIYYEQQAFGKGEIQNLILEVIKNRGWAERCQASAQKLTEAMEKETGIEYEEWT